LDLDPAFNDLVRAYSRGEVVLFAGGGVGQAAGYRSLLDVVIEAVKAANLPPDEKESLVELLWQGDNALDAVAHEIPAQFESVFRREYLKPPSPESLHRLLKEMDFSAVITPNFDSTLDELYASRIDTPATARDAELLLTKLNRREFFLLKLFGTPDDPNTLLVGQAQFEVELSRNRIFLNFLEALLYSRTLVFFGASLDGVDGFLRSLRYANDPARAQHFALIRPEGRGWKARIDSLQRRHNVVVIPIDEDDDGSRLLTELRRRALQLSQDVDTPPAILELLLEHIGPFEKLELSFSPSMNILLGDNGVGKSTILKAIGLALCGEEARPYAARLLRAGQNRGTITVRTTRGDFHAEINRQDSGADLRSFPAAPLQAAAWLVMGFPPLRAPSWERATETAVPTQERPTANDIMPLLSGASDPRIDRVRDWIANIDHRIHQSTNQRDIDNGRRLLDEFFQVIAELIPGVKVELGSVNPTTRDVTVKTLDGEVPIQAVSQGTSALIGWVGVLLQRLFDVYSKEADPRHQPALVLLDEIDAHMHPSWQRLVAPIFRRLFPGVQLIATTHSPLVVPSFAQDQIVLVRRERESQRVVCSRPIADVAAYGTERMLMSSLFNLSSTLAPEVEEELARFLALLNRDDLTAPELDERDRLQKSLAAKLEHQDRSPLFQLLDQAMAQRAATDPERQLALISAAEAQLARK
jgi:hypothetical protein